MAKKRKSRRMNLRPATKYVLGGSKRAKLVEEIQRQIESMNQPQDARTIEFKGIRTLKDDPNILGGYILLDYDDPGTPRHVMRTIRIPITPYLLQDIQRGRLGKHVEKKLKQSAGQFFYRRRDVTSGYMGRYIKFHFENEDTK